MAKKYSCGIVGLPNVGKSTLFNFLTSSNLAKSGNFPFCTIDPNKALVNYADPKLDVLQSKFKSKKKIYSSMEIVDIAGLVEGASKGEGLGNKFLSHIRETNAIIHGVRCFENNDIIHTKNINPVEDLKIIITELVLSDYETLENMKNKTRDQAEKQKIQQLIIKLQKFLEEDEDLTTLVNCGYPVLMSKPFLVLGNGENTTYVEDLKAYCEKRGIIFINFDFSKNENKNIAMLLEHLFQLLNLDFFYTAGEEEARSWLIKSKTKAKEAAAEIHTDISDKFIKAMVFNLKDINGKYRIRAEGKDYELQTGDVVDFKHNAR